MKRRVMLLGLCIVMCMSACSMNKNNQEENSSIQSETEESEMEQEDVQGLDSDLVLLEQEGTVEICDGALIAQIQTPYSGVFWEKEDHEEVSNVYYVKFTNCTDFMIETADITLGDEDGELLFHIDMLKAGETVYVAEADKKEAKSESIRYIDSDIKYVQEESIITDLVQVDLLSDSKLKVTNLTGDFLRPLHVYYAPKNEEDIRISGSAFSVTVDGLEVEQEIEKVIENWSEQYQVVCVKKTEE